MTIPDLIIRLMDMIRREFYGDRFGEFMRDERALKKAVTSYGYHCNQRGWSFEPDFIYRDIRDILVKAKNSKSDITYLPVYLEGAVKRHIGMRAEELSEISKNTNLSRISKLVDGVKPVIVIQPSSAEILAAVYQDINATIRDRREKKRLQTQEKKQKSKEQPNLFKMTARGFA